MNICRNMPRNGTALYLHFINRFMKKTNELTPYQRGCLQQIDLFGTTDTVPIEPVKKQKKRDVHVEAKRILEESGISAMPREEKEYVLAQLINLWFPELESVMKLALIISMHNQRKEEPAQ